MSYCTNIDCLRPQNSDSSRFCNSCVCSERFIAQSNDN
ncbi:4-Cys prefix domain-containing protein [Nostoc edaphicum]